VGQAGKLPAPAGEFFLARKDCFYGNIVKKLLWRFQKQSWPHGRRYPEQHRSAEK
jgi:hypothetical protein